MEPQQPATTPAGLPSPPRYRGEVIYLFAFDLAYDMKREPVGTLLGQPVSEYFVGPSKRNPKYFLFYRPQTIILPPVERRTARGPVMIRRSVKLFSVGAMSVQIRVPFEAASLEELVAYHDLAFEDGTPEDEARQLAEEARRELAPFCIRPLPQIRESEDYTVFSLEDLSGAGVSAEDWFHQHIRLVAGLLAQEQDAGRLSQQEAVESTARYLSYYDTDLVVVDWDAALVAGAGTSLDDVLHIMELANVQLVELEAYDRLLDTALDAAYRDIARRTPGPRRQVRRNLREIRVDLARLSDELVNITKFFGDWYLAEIYQNVSERFHLADWHKILDEKLKTLGDLYDLLQQDRVNLWMVVLEMTIVLLFIIDVVILLAGR